MAYRLTENTAYRLSVRRQTILDAARNAVAERGFGGLAMQDIADGASVAIGTLYRYFPSKNHLCAEIVTDISDREIEILQAIAASDAAPLDRLWAAIHTFSRRALQAPKLAYALMAEPVTPDLDRLRLHYRDELAALFVGLIDECVAVGSLPEQKAAASAAFIVGAFIEGVIGPQAPRHPPFDRHALSDDIAAFCLRGAGAGGQSLAGIAKRRPLQYRPMQANVGAAGHGRG